MTLTISAEYDSVVKQYFDEVQEAVNNFILGRSVCCGWLIESDSFCKRYCHKEQWAVRGLECYHYIDSSYECRMG